MKPKRSCPGVPNRYSFSVSSMVRQPKSSAPVVDVLSGTSPVRSMCAATDMVSRHSSTIARYSNDRRRYAAAPGSVVRTCASISSVWSTGSARPEVSRYGRNPETLVSSSARSTSAAPRKALVWLSAEWSGSMTQSASQGELEFLDEARGQHAGGPVGEQRHLERDGTEAGLLGRQHAEQAADADRAHQQVPLLQFDDHLVRLAERMAVGHPVGEAEHRRADRGEPVRVGAFQPLRRRDQQTVRGDRDRGDDAGGLLRETRDQPVEVLRLDADSGN